MKLLFKLVCNFDRLTGVTKGVKGKETDSVIPTSETTPANTSSQPEQGCTSM